MKVAVYGEFSSKYERLVTASESGQVSEIFVRPGEEVLPDTIIARLVNPDLQQKLVEEQGKLARMQSEFLAFELSKQNELLSFQADLADIESDIQSAQLDVSVNQRLSDQGIAAQIDLERAQLKEKQLQKRLSFANYRYEKLVQMQALEIEQQKILLDQQRKVTDLAEHKVASLTIKAGIEGTLQRFDVELGQGMSVGQAVAKVGSKNELIANLNLPQRLAHRVAAGTPVVLSSQGHVIKGVIEQMGSVIDNGFIVAQIAIEGDTPDSIRPAQPVNAKVFVEQKPDALYVRQRAGLRPLSTVTLFKKIPGKNEVERVEVKFGELSDNYLVIESGARNGDILIIDELKRWEQFSRLKINDEQLEG